MRAPRAANTTAQSPLKQLIDTRTSNDNKQRLWSNHHDRHNLRDLIQNQEPGYTESLETIINNAVAQRMDTPPPDLTEQMHAVWLQQQLRHVPPPAHVHHAQHMFDIPLANHRLVEIYIDYFSGRGRRFFKKWIARFDRYKSIMRPILHQYNLPKDILFLAMIESGFVAHARSSASATGIWQFMRATGRQYGLTQTPWTDDRRDFISATHAAARYLAALYKQFGDWHLAWAAYNAGPGRIRGALKRYNATSYWQLIRHPKSLKLETKHYVPKIIAAGIITKNRKLYGFDNTTTLPLLKYDTITTKYPVDLSKIGKKFKIPLKQLKELNPALLTHITPPNKAYSLRLPNEHADKIKKWIKKTPSHERLSYVRHRIRRGDTLYGIAKRYGSRVSTIRSFNKIKNPRSLKLGRSLIIPQLPKALKTSATTRGKARFHRVRRGDSLWVLAKKYRTTVSQLKRLNRRRSNNLRIGESIRVF